MAPYLISHRNHIKSGSVARWLGGGSVARWLGSSVARWLGGSAIRFEVALNPVVFHRLAGTQRKSRTHALVLQTCADLHRLASPFVQ